LEKFDISKLKTTAICDQSNTESF